MATSTLTAPGGTPGPGPADPASSLNSRSSSAAASAALSPDTLGVFHRLMCSDRRLRAYVEGHDLRTVVWPAHTRFVLAYLAGGVAAAPDGSPYRAEDLALVLEHVHEACGSAGDLGTEPTPPGVRRR
jgi:hypothetical protein